MIILIAESKTMELREHSISSEQYNAHMPFGEKEATEIMDRINGMTAAEIASLLKISGKMAATLKKMAYEFPNKGVGLRAIEAFNGVVFKNLDYASLSNAGKKAVASDVRIISSLYGWLSPDDIIKPYRMDYTSPLSPKETPLYAYWRGEVTSQLVKALQSSGEKDILDLLPMEAAKCIDWKIVDRFAKVWKVDFKEQHGCEMRSPNAGKLKAFRGRLLRHIVENRLTTPQHVAALEDDTMMPITDYEYSDRIAFYV